MNHKGALSHSQAFKTSATNDAGVSDLTPRVHYAPLIINKKKNISALNGRKRGGRISLGRLMRAQPPLPARDGRLPIRPPFHLIRFNWMRCTFDRLCPTRQRNRCWMCRLAFIYDFSVDAPVPINSSCASVHKVDNLNIDTAERKSWFAGGKKIGGFSGPVPSIVYRWG